VVAEKRCKGGGERHLNRERICRGVWRYVENRPEGQRLSVVIDEGSISAIRGVNSRNHGFYINRGNLGFSAAQGGYPWDFRQKGSFLFFQQLENLAVFRIGQDAPHHHGDRVGGFEIRNLVGREVGLH